MDKIWTLENLLQAFILVTGIAGQMLIAHKRKEAFVVWSLSNAALIYVSVSSKLWGMWWRYIYSSA